MADPVGALINIGLQVILRLAIAALTPKQHTEGPRLEDRSLTTSTYGETIPIGYGTALFTGNVIWGRDIREDAVTTDIGKGNPFSLGTNTVYYYYATLAIGICEREMADLIRIYADGKLIYKKDDNTVTERMAGLDFRFYRGTEDQEPDPLIASDYATGETPGYRGLCYIVINDLPLEDFGNRIPQFQFVVAATVNQGTYRSVRFDIPEDRDRPFLNTQEQAVYDRSRNVVYMGAFTNNVPSFDPHFIVAVDASTGDRKFALTIDELNTQVASLFVLGTNVFGNYGRMQSPFPDDEPNIIVGGDTPYLVLIEQGGFGGVHMFIEKDMMRVIGTTYAGGLGENSVILYTSNGDAFPYYKSSRTAQVVDVRSGFLTTYFFVGYTGGLLNGQYWTPEDQASPLKGASRGRGYFLLTALPNFFPYLHNSHVMNSRDGSFGCHGSVIGYRGDGFTDVYTVQRLQFSIPSVFNIVRHRIYYDGSFSDVVMNCDIMVTGFNPGGSYSPDFGTPFFADWQCASLVGLRYDQASDTLVVDTEQNTGTFSAPHIMRGFACNSTATGQPTLDLKWEFRGYQLPSSIHDSASKTSPDGTALILKEGESAAQANFYVLDIDTGAIQQIDLTQGVWEDENGHGVSNYGPSSIWDGPNSRYMALERIFNVSWMYIEPPVTRGAETLQTVVEDICLRSRLTAADIDATALATKNVRGYPVQQEMSFRAALEPLAAVYNFYGVEKDGKIVFQFKDGTTDRTIPEDDLVDQGEGNVVFEEGRGQDADLPRALYFTYQSAEDDWLDERSTQVARRISFPNPAMQATAELKMEVALTLTDLEAQEVTQRILYENWLSQERFKFQLPHRYVSLLPNDVLGVTAEDRAESIRIDKVSISATLEVEVEGRVVEGEVYALNVQPVSQIGSPNIGRDTVIGTTVSRAIGFVLDVPYLQEGAQNDTQALYLFAAGKPIAYGGAFVGAAVAVSANAQPFVFRTQVTSEMAWGQLVTTMPDIPGVDWNSVQEESIDVIVYAGASYFASVTQDDMIQNNANTAILFEPNTGKVEVIGFRDVEFVTGTGGAIYYRLTGFMRGKRGTDTMARGYSSTTYIIIANQAWINGFYEPVALLNADAAYKVVPLGGVADNFTQTDITYEHRALKPWAPCHPTIIEDDPSVGNWTITFERRTRYNGGWQDFLGEVPLNEAGEAFSIDILSGPGGTVVRTINTQTTSFRYTEAMAIADYGSGFPNTLYCKIYQISGTIGRGFANEYALSLE